MPQRLGDLVQSFGYGASAGMTEPARAMLGAALSNDPGLYQVLLDSARQEREQRRKESPVATTIAELGGALASGGAVRTIPQNIAAGAVAGYNEAGNIKDAITGATLTGAASGLMKSLPTQAPSPIPQRIIPEVERFKKIEPLPLEQLPPEIRAELEERGFKAASIVEQYQKFLDNPNRMVPLAEPTQNSIRRLMSIEVDKYKSAVEKARMEFGNIIQSAPEPIPTLTKQYEPIRATLDLSNPMPLSKFVLEATARYKAGAQEQQEIPQPQPVNIPQRYIQR